MKSLIIALALAFSILTPVRAATGPQEVFAASQVNLFLAGLIAILSLDSKQLPCHSRPNVLKKAKGGGYSYYVTDCEANGFK